ncbi:type II toxin-antitoxin system RelE/ParE family toxin [Pedobacter endophyticus]|uniref:Toxin n=1 Tax=Pedobacter endophyticus TaxID=2789740 RepID=A0A7S9KZE6_9SPHI|nr:type II toxin-antitoxin system RelE/ParE family toxin [Pedobacter endophyticus]QPH39645.1 type II toxin-antitoxin system RelE/ParE family toxin [Pedobacter endophyticus]
MRYKISDEAQNDIENIWLYTFETWSAGQADKYYNLLLDEIEYLAENPEAGKKYDHVRKGYLRSNIQSHIIFYKINQEENAIEIIRILHQRMDIDAGLNE